MLGGWPRGRASLFFPLPFHHHHHHHNRSGPLLRGPLQSTFISTSCSISIPTPLKSAPVIKGSFDSFPAPASFLDMFGSGSNHRSSQHKAFQPPLPQTQSSIQNAFRHNHHPSRHNPPLISNALKSSHGPSPNTISQKNPPPRTTPLQMLRPSESVARAFERSSSFADSGFEASPAPVTKSQTQMSALHEAVFFDEGDFEDDGDLDFDDSIVYEPPKLCISASPTSFSVPSPPPPRVPPPLDRKRCPVPAKKRSHESINDTSETQSASQRVMPNSSAPLPWSSSPVEHLGPPTRLSKAPVEVVNLTDEPELEAPEEELNLADEPEPKAPKAKKRKTPWGRAETASSSMFTKNDTASRTDSIKPEPQLPRGKAPPKKSQYPWDMTASDLKKASRRKAEQKRGLSTAVASSERTGKEKALKQKKLSLSNEQMHVLDLVLQSGKSVFFTGSAGTGKSVLMREVIASLRQKYSKEPDRIAVTASTGLAACNVGGVTLHSFAGIGLGKEPVPDLVKKIKRNTKAKNRWLRTRVLIIDEISMVDGELFDKLEAIARTMRNNGRPFGGIQLVITGDFFQLPPVPDYGKIAKFAFDADTWNTTIEHTIGLTQVFRQKDPEFAAILNEMRLGLLSPSSVEVFRRLSRPLEYADGLQATELFPTRQEVDAANGGKIRQLPGNTIPFHAVDGGTILDKSHRDKLLSNCMAPTVIELKVNSQVMLIKNIDDSLVNGSLGRIVGFMDEKTFDLVDNEGGFDTDYTSEPESRASKKIKELTRPGTTKTTSPIWPLVEFALPDGTTRQLLVQPEQWKVELPSGEVQACRTQIPLILAWALSIHKAQGQTLERVKVDLGRVFEKGQAYVALSRATCQEGLQVLRFDAKKVMAHEKVREFYRGLYSAAEAKKKGGNKVEEEFDEEEMEAMRSGSGWN